MIIRASCVMHLHGGICVVFWDQTIFSSSSIWILRAEILPHFLWHDLSCVNVSVHTLFLLITPSIPKGTWLTSIKCKLIYSNNTGWPFTLFPTTRWHQNKGCVSVPGPRTKTELLFWYQREVWTNLMCHLVFEHISDEYRLSHLLVNVGWNVFVLGVPHHHLAQLPCRSHHLRMNRTDNEMY